MLRLHSVLHLFKPNAGLNLNSCYMKSNCRNNCLLTKSRKRSLQSIIPDCYNYHLEPVVSKKN